MTRSTDVGAAAYGAASSSPPATAGLPEDAQPARRTPPVASHAAYRMARDPAMSVVDVQWVLGHAQLTTTQLYLNPVPDEVIANVLAYHARRSAGPVPASAGDVGTGPVYQPETLNILFGEHPS